MPNIHIGYDTRRQKTRRALFKHPLALLSKKTRVEEGEMETEIINSEVNQTESTIRLSSSVVLDDHSCCWQKGTQNASFVLIKGILL